MPTKTTTTNDGILGSTTSLWFGGLMDALVMLLFKNDWIEHV